MSAAEGGHLRDFVGPGDKHLEVLDLGGTPTGRALHMAGRAALGVLGARCIDAGVSGELWRFPMAGDTQAVMRLHEPETVIPALLRHHDMGLFYTYTGRPSSASHAAGPLWVPEVDQTHLLDGVETGAAETDALVSVVAALAYRSRHLRTAGRLGAQLVGPARDWRARRKWNPSTDRTKAEIAEHYDIKPEVYTGPTGFLDDEWVQYSSGLLAPGQSAESTTLEQLQRTKVESIIRKLELDSAETVLEIGSGWGGLAVAIAKAAPHVHVTSLTLSHEQALVARQRVAEAGLEERVTILEQDYREHAPQHGYDRVVSIEMIEAVDFRDIDMYFDHVTEFVDPESGVVVLQAITVPDSKEPSQHHRDSFANVAIFPGGYLSSVEKIVENVAKRGFVLHELTETGPSYSLTLQAWLRNLNTHRPELTERWQREGHTLEQIDRFYRGFSFYLAACVAGFRPETGPNMGGQQLVFRAAA